MIEADDRPVGRDAAIAYEKEAFAGCRLSAQSRHTDSRSCSRSISQVHEIGGQDCRIPGKSTRSVQIGTRMPPGRAG